MKIKKIVLIGAGSAVFTRGLVADLILSPDLGPFQLGLVDINPDALATAEGLTSKMIAARDADISVEASTERRDVLPGADLVVITIGVGGRRGWEKDVFIPRQFGIFQPVGDSVMPGGISRAMRMVPALLDIAHDIQALCPDTMVVNYSNPMTVNCWAIQKATGLPVVGLCHGTFHVERELGSLIGAKPAEITSCFAGLNHLTFLYDYRWKGEDAFPLLRERLEKEKGLPPDPNSIGKTFPAQLNTATNPFSWELFETYGAYPAVNDRHVTEFFPERFPDGNYYGMKLGVDAFSVEEIIAWGDARYEAMRAQAVGEEPLDESYLERAVGEHEQLLEIIRSITFDQRRVFAANVPNRGAIPNLPADAVLEMPVVASATGMRPVQLLDYPEPLAAIITKKISSARLTVEAALHGDRKMFVEALLMDGAVQNRETGTKLMEALLEAHRQHLPNFFA